MNGEEQELAVSRHEQEQQRVVIGGAGAMFAEEAGAQCQEGGGEEAGGERSGDRAREQDDEEQGAERRQRRGQAHRPLRRAEQGHAARHQPDEKRRLGVPEIGLEAVGGDEAEARLPHFQRVHRRAGFVPEDDRRGAQIEEEEEGAGEEEQGNDEIVPQARPGEPFPTMLFDCGVHCAPFHRGSMPPHW